MARPHSMETSSELDRQFEAYVASTRANALPIWKKHLRSWSLYAAAAGSALAFTTAADAEIVYSGPLVFGSGIILTRTRVEGPVPLFTGLVMGLEGKTRVSGGKVFRDGTASLLAGPGVGVARDRNRLSLLKTSNRVGPSRNFGGYGILNRRTMTSHVTSKGKLVKSTSVRGFFQASKPGFAGFRILKSSPGGMPNYQYGWIKLHWYDGGKNSPFPFKMRVLGFAYQTTPNKPIHVPDVPEPSTGSLTLLALGAAGVFAWREHRKSLSNR